jgi:signal transduction histidine kinase
MDTPEQRPLEHTTSPGAGAEKEGLESVLDAQPFPALVVEQATGKTVLANEAARRLGLAPSSQSPAGAVFHGADAQGGKVEAARLARHLLAQAEGSEGVELAWYPPEQTLFFRVFCRLLSASPARPALALLSFVDVSREKEAEASLRTTLEARDEFFSIATHELKDPLFALQLSIQLLRRAAEKQGEVPNHVRQHLEVSHRQADRLNRLIDNLLDVSRIVNHRLRLDPEALDLCELASETVARMQDKAQHSGTTLEVQACEPIIAEKSRYHIRR